MAVDSGYLHDVFISYPHEPHHEKWVGEIFYGQFELHFRQALGRRAEIFVDRDGIRTGDEWKARLKQSLARSKILVPIWSINYFESDWCKGECAVMSHRENQLGFRSNVNPRGLIIPVRLFDWRRYPNFARDIQHCDCTQYNLIGDFFKKSEGFLRFQAMIQNWIPDVAMAIRDAPPWAAEWLTREWMEDPIEMAKVDPRFRCEVIPFEVPSLGRAV